MLKSPVCVDANVIIALVTAEHFSRGALALCVKIADERLPALHAAFASLWSRLGVHRKALERQIKHEDAGQALAKALACDIRFLDPMDINVCAFDLAAR